MSKPTNLKDLAVALSNGISPGGAIQSGLAVEVAPEKFLSQSPTDSPAKTALGGLALSLASNVTGSAPMQTTSLAFGVRWVLGAYDPATDFDGLGACLGDALPDTATAARKSIPGVPGPDGQVPGALKVQSQAPTLTTVQALADCRTVFRNAHLASRGIEVAYAHIDQALNSTKLDDIRPHEDTGWVSVALAFRSFTEDDLKLAALVHTYGDALVTNAAAAGKDSAEAQKLAADMQAKLDKCSLPEAEKTRTLCDADVRRQLWQAAAHSKKVTEAKAFGPIFFGRVDSQRIMLNETPRQLQLQLSARLPLISDGWSVFFEGGYKFTDFTGAVSPTPKNSAPVGLGGDVRLSDGTWLGVYFGYDIISGALLSLGNLKWSIGETRPYSYN